MRYFLAPLIVLLFGGSVFGARSTAVLPAFYSPNYVKTGSPLMFMRQAPPPIDNFQTRTTYAFGPITDSVALNIAGQNRSKWTRGHKWPMVWANRARVPSGYTLIPGNPTYPYISDQAGNLYRSEFTTPAKANAVTMAQALYIMGASAATWQAPLLAAGMSASDAIPWAKLNANPSLYFTNTSQDGKSKVLLDKMWIPFAVSRAPYGVTLDYEVQDHRSEGEGVDFLFVLGAKIRSYGLKAYLYTNPWESPSTQSNGFSFDRIDEVKANWDYISLYIWGAQNRCDFDASYPAAVAFLKGPSGRLNFSQILITFDMKLCNEVTAKKLYNIQIKEKFAGYNMFADGAVQGGPLWVGTNAVIWALLYGS